MQVPETFATSKTSRNTIVFKAMHPESAIFTCFSAPRLSIAVALTGGMGAATAAWLQITADGGACTVRAFLDGRAQCHARLESCIRQVAAPRDRVGVLGPQFPLAEIEHALMQLCSLRIAAWRSAA